MNGKRGRGRTWRASRASDDKGGCGIAPTWRRALGPFSHALLSRVAADMSFVEVLALPEELALKRGTPDCKWRVCVDRHWPVPQNGLLKDHSDAKYDWDNKLHVWWTPLYHLNVLAELQVWMLQD